MSEMVERVARTIFAAHNAERQHSIGLTWDKDAVEWERAEYRNMARAAITALRKPTKAMEAAGEDLDDWGVPSDPGSGNASALSHWVAMIDEALK